jgi:ATP-dependent DNA helicase RecG
MTAKHLSLILAAGEGYRIEFKEQMANLDKEMVAFANASGGFIYLGINDDRVVQGIEITNKLKSQIQDIARNCDPPVQILLDAYKNILIIEVREGMDKPYRCSTGFYNRTGPNAQKMKRDEIIEFVKSEGKIRFDEMVNRNFPVAEFDDAKFDKFLKLAGISKVMETEEILQNLHAAEVQLGTCYYYNTAVLFFAKNLDKHFFHTCVTCALYKGLDKVTILDRKDFNHDIIDNIDKAMIFLQQHLNVRYEFDGSPARKEIPEIPIEALREAVINAVIHRDYFEKGANAMVEIYDDRVEITNPGGLPKGLKEKDFGKISILRNPNIANLMQRIEYIEKMGTGIRRMQKMLAGAGLPPIKYEFSSFVRAVFFRPREERVNFEVNDREADYYASTPQVPRKYPASKNREGRLPYLRFAPSPGAERKSRHTWD